MNWCEFISTPGFNCLGINLLLGWLLLLFVLGLYFLRRDVLKVNKRGTN